MEIRRESLSSLLGRTQRKCHIMGKRQNQVMACVLRCEGGKVSTTSLVRDGKTSLSRFSAECGEGEATIPIPDIDRLLGVLKAHGERVRLACDKDRIRVKSVGKQTTLTANLEGLAFPHSRDTIGEWEAKSLARAEQIRADGYFIAKTEETRGPIATWTLDAEDLRDALSCDAINGQMLNRYTFRCSDDGLTLSVGGELKGQTVTLLSDEKNAEEAFEVTVEGGLDNAIRGIKGKVVLQFYDFRDFEQGIRLLIRFEGGDFVLQAGLL